MSMPSPIWWSSAGALFHHDTDSTMSPSPVRLIDDSCGGAISARGGDGQLSMRRRNPASRTEYGSL